MAKIIRFRSLESSGPITANNGTLTASVPVLDLSQTWNNAAVTFTSLRLNVTNTASGANSLLLDLQTGGTTLFSIGSLGNINLTSPLSGNTSGMLRISNDTTGNLRPGILSTGNGTSLATYGNGAPATNNGCLLSNFIFASSGLTMGGGGVNSGNGIINAFVLNGTFTNSNSFERFFIDFNSVASAFRLGTQKGSAGGTARSLEFHTDGAVRAKIDTSGNLSLCVGATIPTPGGPLHIKSSNGAGGSRNLLIQTDSTTSGHSASIGFGVTTADNSIVSHRIESVRGASLADSDFRFVISNVEYLRIKSNGLLQFQGTTSSFPAIKRNGSNLNIRLADDSGDAGITCSTLTLSDNLTFGSGDNIVLSTTTGTQIGTATTQLLGFYGATPVDRPDTVSDPTGGTTIDSEARTAINTIIDRLQELGLIA